MRGKNSRPLSFDFEFKSLIECFEEILFEETKNP